MEDTIVRMPLIGETAPAFQAVTTQGTIRFPEDYSGKWVVLFSHPADFTAVCTTEFIVMANKAEQFSAMNTELIGISVDSIYAHFAWLRTIYEKIEYKEMKQVEVLFPLIEDMTMEISRKYGMIHPKQSPVQAVRTVFIIDPQAVIRCVLCYPNAIGRNVDEVMRIVQALQKSDAEGIATPADWQPGEDVIVPPVAPIGSAEDRDNYPNSNMHCLDWFTCFKHESSDSD